MSRKFPNWIEAFELWATDQKVPAQFNTFVGLSAIAGALERKVWLPWSENYSFYPNIYVILVALPNVGKSLAISKAVDLLRGISGKGAKLNIMPSSVTEAKFIELMGHGKSFIDTSTGKEVVTFQNAGYFYASEASNTLRNVYGPFIECLTDLYDCPKVWERSTKKDGKTISLQNVCVNMIAGSTFDYLGKLINDENIQGGFASRIIYVVHDDKEIKAQKFQSGLDDNDRIKRSEFMGALEDDLLEINKMNGPMSATPEFREAWEKWYVQAEEHRLSYKSERMQSLLARINPNAIKISMLYSAAESSDRIMKIQHWEKAVAHVNSMAEMLPRILSQAKAAQGPGKPGSQLSHYIIQLAKTGCTIAEVKSWSVMNGHFNHLVEPTILSLIQTGLLIEGEYIVGRGTMLTAKENAEADLA